MDWSTVATDLQENWHLYALMPFVAAAIGWFTKLVAVEMLFRPLEFKGIPPYLGWQGLVPRYSARMATVAVDLMLARLIDPQEIIDRIDPEELAKHIQEPMLDTVADVVHELMMRHQPGIWELLPDQLRRILIRRIQSDSPRLIAQMMDDLKVNVDLVFDMRSMAIDALMRDKALTVRMIREIAAPEMRFIVRSGLVFGFVLGIVQAVIWAFTHSALIMPLFGAFVGYSTDWLALQMVFRPIEPKRYLSVFRWQGLFHKRRDQVAVDYGGLIANEILTPANIIHAMLTGPQSDRLFSLVEYEVQRVLDQQLGRAKPLVEFAIGPSLEAMKHEVVDTMRARLPDSTRQIEEYTMRALDVHAMVIEKMRLMTNDEYENILRPAFKQDEWKIVAVGAVLGFLIGELQVLLLLH
ncbi:uncharacterized protein DUF445 [Nocardia tenerifensis]|uniref:Uncharacterized protein DUF445 n=1 Tax=Nocardia tenerifensis TaxID=228006 RepID=A0A318JXQ3_9NOCA|nr:DUF445 family protein [Nocardia tenerifensis]PXX58450.1 uncharacterized protein DUF445 [Nocardia tenerifensis]